MRARGLIAWIALASLVAIACGDDPIVEDPAVTVRMDFTRPDFFAAPFPSDDLRAADGRIDVARYPNPGNPFVTQLTRILAADARGFASTGGVFFSLTGPIDPSSLPDLAGSIAPGATVALVDTTDGRRFPVHVELAADGGPYGAPNLLSVVPLQGIVLPPLRTFAVALSRGVRAASGAPLAPSAEMRALASGAAPSGMSDATFARYRDALAALERAGTRAEELAGLAVFTTGDPTAELLSVTRDAALTALPAISAPKRAEVFERYCVYNAQMEMPDYQSGAPPFSREGGAWVVDASGRAALQRRSPSRVVITVPRAPAPPEGFPLGVMIRTGGGGDRPLVDRGAHDAGGSPIEQGAGPARELARVGFAGASFDGPHAGARNPTNGDEQFLMFNIENIVAIRDNVRQSALETALFAAAMAPLSFDASDCPGAGVVRFDVSRVALIGHSMGATIAPLALFAEPRFRAAILGGAGASWIENVLFKQKPVAVRPIVELLLGYQNEERALRRGDPVLTLVQWALEPADPLVYDPWLVRAPRAGELPRHILVQQGIVDHYIMPTIANAMSLSMGLDLAGDALDAQSPELRADAAHTPLEAHLPLSGGRRIALPASANAGGATAVVRQYPEDGIEDGHEIMFQSEAPKAELRCFLRSLGGAAPVVTDACAED
ncbi:MAG: hypothetical protein KF819_38330 [Labilithrix sp.]|nr:hypothetical protein [Labilithrix sp.]